ncbi:hypothetical protein O181_011806 [Austropuccinia psidii MF-1]|uniref:Retrotransposon gag domain-containing protein n=1 Tax=Austropuccinia psidii MF-1 TaxID=1389203 RepID=A0A9Q3GLP1_9BASI|nr:hypothetical protein [Austropuccinia psidii MF-1]
MPQGSQSFSGLFGSFPSTSECERARLREVGDKEGGDFGETEVAHALANAPEVAQSSNLVLSSQPVVSQTEPSLLKMMEHMTQFMGQLTQEINSRGNSKAPAFKTPSMKAPDYFDGTQARKLRVVIQSCKMIFHNYPESFISDRKEVLYSTSFLFGRAGNRMEPYLPNISHEDPSYLLNNWQLFETQLITLFGDPNEVRKAEQELHNLRIKESGHIALYISDVRH